MKVRIRSSGIVIVRRCDALWHYLLLRCFSNWDFPKGELDAEESEFDTALREVREETGLEALRFNWGKEFIETEPYSRGKIARYYLAEAPHGQVILGVSPELGRPEHDEFRWLTYRDAAALTVPRITRVLAWAARRIGDTGRAA